MSDCLFCRIVAGEIPSAKVYEDETCFAFRDINPQAKVHVILVPREHVADWKAFRCDPGPHDAGSGRDRRGRGTGKRIQDHFQLRERCLPEREALAYPHHRRRTAERKDGLTAVSKGLRT